MICFLAVYILAISIHSLVKRETVGCRAAETRTHYFNPLPRKEGDTTVLRRRLHDTDFNPLPRKEGDQSPVHRAAVWR